MNKTHCKKQVLCACVLCRLESRTLTVCPDHQGRSGERRSVHGQMNSLSRYRLVIAGARYDLDHLFLHDHLLHPLSGYPQTTEQCGMGERQSILSRRRSTRRRNMAGIPTSSGWHPRCLQLFDHQLPRS
ncbi:hypothetical protein DPEC_G00267560 [Dallia pectoralis]|uniref:Uncharacterized protein n=1 Tax=Dallia pectoralis TaxID=75939 RepID=A0ACC2FNQ5_DALPE|nr:hypothetical protein DPEC_G00267560 [Dallia pectoralis]